MADNSEFIEVTSPAALKNLQAVNAELLKTIASVKDVNANMIGIKTPSGSDSAIKSLTAQYDAQRATIQKLQQQLNSLSITQSKVATSASTQAKATRENSVAQQILRAETDRNIRANTLLGGAYARASAQLLILKKEAKDAAIAFGEESVQAKKAAAAASDLDKRIKTADASVGDYQRNVGNYTGGVVGGFKAIYSQARILANLLPGIGIGGIFGLALSPLYDYVIGLKIVTDTFGIETEAIKKSKEALVEKAQAEDEARGKLASYQSDEISRSKILFENAKNLELPYSKRLASIKELQTRYPDYLGNLSKEKFLAGDTADAEEKLNEALIKRGIALASQQLIQEEINNGLKNEKWISDKLNEIQKNRLDLAKQLNAIDPFTTDENQRAKYEELKLQLERLYYLEGTLKDQYTSKNDKIKASIKYYIDQYNANAKYLDIVHEETKATKDKTKAQDEYNVSSLKALQNTINALKEQYQSVAVGSTAYGLLGNQIKLLETIYDGLTKTIKDNTEEINGIELTDEQVYADVYAWYKLRDATNEYVKTLASGQLEKSLNSIGLASAKMFLDFDELGQSTFDKLIDGADTLQEKIAINLQAIGDVAQEVFGKIFELSNQRFQNEYANLQKEKDVAIAFAGDSAAARAEIELQYQARQKKIKEREFKAKKEQAEFNIIIDTAQAVVAALPNIPLSIAIAAIGAVQLALVASQQTPQYEHGTENHIGGAMIINDQKGSNYKELVTTPDGKSRIYEGRNVKVNAPKGTKVKTASETMDYLMFNDNLNSILTGNNISTPIIEVNNNANFDKIGRDIINAIENKAEFSQLISNGDLKTVIRKGNTETEIMNRRINFLGKKV